MQFNELLEYFIPIIYFFYPITNKIVKSDKKGTLFYYKAFFSSSGRQELL